MSSVRIGPLKSGILRMYGYSSHEAQHLRREALLKAMRDTEPLRVWHRLNALVVLNKNRPQLHKKFLNDRNFVRKFL